MGLVHPYNFVKVCNSKLARGLEAGVAAHLVLVLNWGFIIVAGEIRVVPAYNCANEIYRTS